MVLFCKSNTMSFIDLLDHQLEIITKMLKEICKLELKNQLNYASKSKIDDFNLAMLFTTSVLFPDYSQRRNEIFYKYNQENEVIINKDEKKKGSEFYKCDLIDLKTGEKIEHKMSTCKMKTEGQAILSMRLISSRQIDDLTIKIENGEINLIPTNNYIVKLLDSWKRKCDYLIFEIYDERRKLLQEYKFLSKTIQLLNAAKLKKMVSLPLQIYIQDKFCNNCSSFHIFDNIKKFEKEHLSKIDEIGIKEVDELGPIFLTYIENKHRCDGINKWLTNVPDYISKQSIAVLLHEVFFKENGNVDKRSQLYQTNEIILIDGIISKESDAVKKGYIIFNEYPNVNKTQIKEKDKLSTLSLVKKEENMSIVKEKDKLSTIKEKNISLVEKEDNQHLVKDKVGTLSVNVEPFEVKEKPNVHRKECAKITRKGFKCKKIAIENSDYCSNHYLHQQYHDFKYVDESRKIKCIGKTKKGEQCERYAIDTKLYCWHHAPPE